MRNLIISSAFLAIGYTALVSRREEAKKEETPSLPIFTTKREPQKPQPKNSFIFSVLVVGRDEIKEFFDRQKFDKKQKEPRLDRLPFKGKIKKGGKI